MKVLYVLSSNQMGGATISFLNLILNLDKKLVTPIVVIPNQCKANEFDQVLEDNDIEYHRILLYSSVLQKLCLKNSLRWVVKYLVLYFQKKRSRSNLEKLVLSVNPDIIHTNTGVIHEGFHLAKKYHIPHVWHLREYQTLDFGWYIYPSYKSFCSYLKQSYVITITEKIQNYFNLDNYNKACTIYNGIYRKKECIMSIHKENYFLMASRIFPEKGHLDVIKAFSSFSRNNEYRLKIVGYGNETYIAELKELAKTCNCENNIDFLGFQKDVKEIMSKAKALVVASFNEGFGRMTAEAAFCGTLVIGRNTAGTKEILDRTGGFPFYTINEMTEQMEFVASMSESDYLYKVQKAQKAAVDNYSIENNIDKICSLYREIFKS